MTAPTFAAQTTIATNAPLATDWDALVNPALVKQYLHGTTMEADWRVGGAITWRGKWKGQPYEDNGTALQFEPRCIVSTTHWSPLSGTADRPENHQW